MSASAVLFDLKRAKNSAFCPHAKGWKVLGQPEVSNHTGSTFEDTLYTYTYVYIYIYIYIYICLG